MTDAYGASPIKRRLRRSKEEIDGYPCRGGLSVDPRTVAALVRAGWIDRDGRPIHHEVGIPSDA